MSAETHHVSGLHVFSIFSTRMDSPLKWEWTGHLQRIIPIPIVLRHDSFDRTLPTTLCNVTVAAKKDCVALSVPLAIGHHDKQQAFRFRRMIG